MISLLQCLANVLMLLQPPVFNSVSIGILVAAQLVDADLVVNIFISIPADCNVVLIHLAKVSWETIL